METRKQKEQQQQHQQSVASHVIQPFKGEVATKVTNWLTFIGFLSMATAINHTTDQTIVDTFC